MVSKRHYRDSSETSSSNSFSRLRRCPALVVSLETILESYRLSNQDNLRSSRQVNVRLKQQYITETRPGIDIIADAEGWPTIFRAFPISPHWEKLHFQRSNNFYSARLRFYFLTHKYSNRIDATCQSIFDLHEDHPLIIIHLTHLLALCIQMETARWIRETGPNGDLVPSFLSPENVRSGLLRQVPLPRLHSLAGCPDGGLSYSPNTQFTWRRVVGASDLLSNRAGEKKGRPRVIRPDPVPRVTTTTTTPPKLHVRI